MILITKTSDTMKSITIFLSIILALGLLMQAPAGAKAPEKNQKAKKEKAGQRRKAKLKTIQGIGPFFNHRMLEKTMRQREI